MHEYQWTRWMFKGDGPWMTCSALIQRGDVNEGTADAYATALKRVEGDEIRLRVRYMDRMVVKLIDHDEDVMAHVESALGKIIESLISEDVY